MTNPTNLNEQERFARIKVQAAVRTYVASGMAPYCGDALRNAQDALEAIQEQIRLQGERDGTQTRNT